LHYQWFSLPMSVVKKALSTDMLPQCLSDRQRFIHFAQLFEHFSNTGELDPAPDVPFRAAMNSIHIATTMLGRCNGTFTTVRREYRQVLATNDDRYCLARNAGDKESRVTHRSREIIMRPGAMVLLKLDEPFFAADGANTKRFTNVHLPTATLRAMVAHVDEMVGCEFEPGGGSRWRWIIASVAGASHRRRRGRHSDRGASSRSRSARPRGPRRSRDCGEAGRLARGEAEGCAPVWKSGIASRISPRTSLPRRSALPSAMPMNCCLRPVPVYDAAE
jgi:hypothetical protein